MITFRNYQTRDYPFVKSLLQDANMFADTWESEENLEGMIKYDPESIIVATDGDKIIGNIFIIPYGSKIAHLYRLVIEKDYRNKGIATKLLEYVEKIVKKKGIIELSLYADFNDSELSSFYEKKGFVTSNHPYICMWKELK